MTTSLILLILQLAMSLLTAVQQNPNLPASFREQAFQSANQAIQLALQAIQTHPENPPTVAAIPNTSAPVSPVSTNTIQTNSQPQALESSNPSFVAEIPLTTIYNGSYLVVIKIKSKDGEALPDKQVQVNGREYTSDGNGIIYYPVGAGQAREAQRCGLGRLTVLVTDGIKTYGAEVKVSGGPPMESRGSGSGVLVCA